MGWRATRREFLGRAGAASLVALAGPPGSAPAWRRAHRRRGALARRLRGTLVLPGQAGYAAAKAIYNPRLDIAPRAIAFCETPGDVAQVIAFARARRWPVAARSGRHSFAGLFEHARDRGRRLAHASCPLRPGLGRPCGRGRGQLAGRLRRGSCSDTGSPCRSATCPTVGIAGLALGGGFGHLVRRAGLLCDSLEAVDLVLADGRRVRASARSAPDLFWASRGGGGGNFGVATEFTFRTLAAVPLTTFSLSFPWARAGGGARRVAADAAAGPRPAGRRPLPGAQVAWPGGPTAHGDGERAVLRQ